MRLISPCVLPVHSVSPGHLAAHLTWPYGEISPLYHLLRAEGFTYPIFLSGHLAFIAPEGVLQNPQDPMSQACLKAMLAQEDAYKALIALNVPPEKALVALGGSAACKCLISLPAEGWRELTASLTLLTGPDSPASRLIRRAYRVAAQAEDPENPAQLS